MATLAGTVRVGSGSPAESANSLPTGLGYSPIRRYFYAMSSSLLFPSVRLFASEFRAPSGAVVETKRGRNSWGEHQFRSVWGVYSSSPNRNRRVAFRKFVVKAVGSDDDIHFQNDPGVSRKDIADKPQNKLVAKLHESVGSFPLFAVPIRKHSGMNITIALCVIATMIVILVKSHRARNPSYSYQGSVADLVRRGQIKSDRRGISSPLKYEDPFNNPMVKVSKSNSTVEMCGKVYRLAPVSLTDELKMTHQKRRSRAYQWKRPKIFLKEGEPIPQDVDPDTVRWIPANHPFATTSSDIDEDLAQNNVYQKHGVPFRIQAEHEALQRKLEALQNEQKLGKLVIDPAVARDFERPLKSQTKPENPGDHNTLNSKTSSNPPSDQLSNPTGNKPPSGDMQTP